MPISFACSCGKQLAAKEEHAGKLIKCPVCSRERIVPNGESPDKPPKEPLDFSKSSRPRRRKRERPKERRRVLWPWFVGAGVGALALLAIPLAFFLGRNANSADSRRPAKEATPVASASPEKTAGQTPPKPNAAVTPAEVKQPAQPTPPIVNPVTPKPDEKPLTGEEKRLHDSFAVRLLRFGPARIVEADFRGSSFTGAVLELGATAAQAKARLEASSIAATDRDGKPVPAAVVFIAGGRDGLGPTATVLAGTTGEAFDVLIGKSRFAPGPFPPSMRGLRNVKTGDVPATAQVNPRLNDFVINVTDLMMLMPVNLTKGGGVEYTLLPSRKAQIGVVFAADADKLTDIKLLGHTLPLEPAKRDNSPFPADVARGGPQMPPGPGVPAPVENDPTETTGLWTVKAEGGEPSLLLDDFNCHAIAVTKDMKQRAIFRPPPQGGVAGKLGAGGDQLAVGPMDKPLRVVWAANGRVLAMPGTTSLYWSASGQHLLLTTFTGFAVVDLKGKARGFGRGTALSPLVGSSLLESTGAHWIGRSDTEVAVLSLSPPRRLVVLNTATGLQRELCPVPPSVSRITFRVSDDQRTVAIFVSESTKGEPERNAGVWAWRRGQKAPVLLGAGNPATGALSPDGKYIAATLEQAGKRRCVVYQVADKKELWTADCPASDFAFDPTGKRLAITTGKEKQLLVTPLDKFEPTELVKGKTRSLDEPAWSSDGKEIVFRRVRQQRPGVFRP